MSTERLSTRFQTRAGPTNTSDLGGSGYGTRTLVGNWVEERRDSRFNDGRPVLGTELEKVWKSTYRHQTDTTKGVVNQPKCSQLQLVDIAEGRRRCFPGHQPETDPEHNTVIKSAFCTTTHMSFNDPKSTMRVADEFVPPVKGGTPNAQAMAVIARMRHKILKRTQSTFAGLRRSLRSMDNNGNGLLNARELKAGLEYHGIALSDPEIAVLVRYFDKSGDGEVSVVDFVRGIRGEMNERRTALVHKAFTLLEKNCDGTVTLPKVAQLYDASQHPRVIDKTMKAEDVLRDFMDQWDETNDDVITLEEFTDHYNDMSACIDADHFFEVMMRNCWHISGGEGSCRNTSCRRVMVIHTNGRRTMEEIKNDLGIAPAEFDKMKANLISQGIHDVAKIELSDRQA